jgi:hypothetical protein
MFMWDVGDTVAFVSDPSQSTLLHITLLQATVCHGGCVQNFYEGRVITRDPNRSSYMDSQEKYAGVRAMALNLSLFRETELCEYDPTRDVDPARVAAKNEWDNRKKRLGRGDEGDDAAE